MSELKILSHLGYHDNIVNLLGACTQGGNQSEPKGCDRQNTETSGLPSLSIKIALNQFLATLKTFLNIGLCFNGRPCIMYTLWSLEFVSSCIWVERHWTTWTGLESITRQTTTLTHT